MVGNHGRNETLIREPHADGTGFPQGRTQASGSLDAWDLAGSPQALGLDAWDGPTQPQQPPRHQQRQGGSAGPGAQAHGPSSCHGDLSSNVPLVQAWQRPEEREAAT